MSCAPLRTCYHTDALLICVSLVYEALAQQLISDCPWLEPPPLDGNALKGGVAQRFQNRLLLGWFEATGCHLLTGPVLRHAIATHCRLPVFPVPERCQ